MKARLEGAMMLQSSIMSQAQMAAAAKTKALESKVPFSDFLKGS
jgi:hypothetical protein